MTEEEELRQFSIETAAHLVTRQATRLVEAFGRPISNDARRALFAAARTLAPHHINALVEEITRLREEGTPTPPEADPLLSVAEAAAMAGVRPNTWTGQVSRSQAPPADDPDLDSPPERRRPRWRRSTVARHLETHTRRRKG